MPAHTSPFFFMVSQVTSVVVLVMMNSIDLVKRQADRRVIFKVNPLKMHILQILNAQFIS